MQIAPNTTIKILKGVPLDSDYQHTIYFTSLAAQESFFSGKTKFTFNNQSYARVTGGKLKLYKIADSLYDCNYLMFKNTNYGNKWFYAFITKVNYINDSTSEVEFEIDVMQTWHFDYILGSCFIERQHAPHDTYAFCATPEKLDIGQRVVCHSSYEENFSDLYYMVVVSQRAVQNSVTDEWELLPIEDGVEKGKLYTGLQYLNGGTTVSNLANLIAHYVDHGFENAIVRIYGYPSRFYTASTTNIDSTYPDERNTDTTYRNISRPISLDGYIPKNKKLLYYPYSYLEVSNNNGQTATYRWENWYDPDTAMFRIKGNVFHEPNVFCYPVSHRGISEDFDTGILLGNFPEIPWVGDIYAAYVAQNKMAMKNAISNTVVGSLMQGAPNIAEGFSSGIGMGALAVGATVLTTGMHLYNVLDTMKENKYRAEHTPATVHSQVACEALNLAMNRMKFSFYCMTIDRYTAEKIDEFFERYGYAVNEMSIPNRNARPYWTYVKTQDCAISGDIPSDDAKKISSIYDNGITWWNNGNNVGNYSLDNRVT